jgi:hypothetical protein
MPFTLFIRRNKPDLFLLVAFLVIGTTCFVLLLSALGFFAGVGMSRWHLPLSLSLSAALDFSATRSFDKENRMRLFLSSLAVVVIFFGISVLIAGYFIDTSWDGQFYHQEAVYQLKEGWNPHVQFLPDSLNTSIWINHYPKAAEIPQAAVYSFTGKIETGKATNLMVWLASFALGIYFFSVLTNFSFRKVALYALLLSCSPIAVNQAFTYYIDGQVSAFLLCLLYTCILVYRSYNRWHLLLLGFITIICINLKFTSLIYAALLLFAFLLLLLVLRRMELFRKALLALAVAGVVGVAVAGYNPYITNTVHKGHPFYPVIGNPDIGVMDGLMPAGFEEKSGLERFFISFFSHTDDPGPWLSEPRSPQLKVPFMLNRYDLSYSRIENARIAGFGPFFSGIFLVSLLLGIWALRKKREGTKRYLLLSVPVMLLLTVFLFPQSWWARFIPQLWFVPFCLLLLAETADRKNRWINYAKHFVYAAILLNIGFSLLSIPFRVLKTEQVRYQMRQLKALNQPIKVEWKEARSNRVRFTEFGLPYTEQKIDEPKVGYIVGSNTRFEKTSDLPNLPQPFLLRTLGRFAPQ